MGSRQLSIQRCEVSVRENEFLILNSADVCRRMTCNTSPSIHGDPVHESRKLFHFVDRLRIPPERNLKSLCRSTCGVSVSLAAAVLGWLVRDYED